MGEIFIHIGSPVKLRHFVILDQLKKQKTKKDICGEFNNWVDYAKVIDNIILKKIVAVALNY